MTEEEKWIAVISNDAAADGLFYYAVKSTGIFCRPSCKSKPPARQNVLFFERPQDALAAGFRPCKRCRPELLEYQPLADVALRARCIIKEHHGDKQRLADEMRQLGVSKRRLAQIFKQQYGLSPTEYLNQRRIITAKEQLQTGSPVIDAAFTCGFDNLSAFFAFFRKYTGMTPGEYKCHKDREDFMKDTVGAVYDTDLGQIVIAAKDDAIVSVQFGGKLAEGMVRQKTPLTDLAAKELGEYFTGQRKSFDLPLALEGTAFQKRVWQALCQIPYGEIRSYKEVAMAIGSPNASRAVGMANNKNPILLLIPCHRVVGSKGALVGYAGGLAIKQKLLMLEQGALDSK